jgi:magnesium transporter
MPEDTAELRRWVAETDPYTLAHELNHAEADRRGEVFRLLPPDKVFEVFSHLDASSQADVLPTLDEATVTSMLNEMEPDDRVRMLAEMPDDEAERLLSKLDAPELHTTRLLMRYPEQSAGRLMSPAFVRLRADMTVDEALAHVRRENEQAETIYLLPVTDDALHLVGAIELRDLVVAAPEQPIAPLIKDVAVVSAYDDQEAVARLVKSADLLALPVVEEDRRLVGLITFDDAMDVLEFEEGEDFARTGAAEPVGKPYLSVSVVRLVRSRIVWLSVLALAATLTVNVLSAFEATLESVVSLALFIPLLIGIGGNTGAQSATTLVRALAVNDVRTGDILRVAGREARAGFLLGTIIGLVGLLLVTLLFEWSIAVIVALTLVTICTLAALVGSVMPIIARLLGVDPAVFSAPFVTTIVDASGLLVYFLIAKAVLGV